MSSPYARRNVDIWHPLPVFVRLWPAQCGGAVATASSMQLFGQLAAATSSAMTVALICWFRRPLREHRRFMRARLLWEGSNPDSPGLAHELGLTSRMGEPPVLTFLGDCAAGPRYVFVLPGGVSIQDFERRKAEIADALNGAEVRVSQVRPGTVEVIVMKRDLLDQGRSAGWADTP